MCEREMGRERERYDDERNGGTERGKEREKGRRRRKEST